MGMKRRGMSNVNVISPGDVTNTGVYNETLHKL